MFKTNEEAFAKIKTIMNKNNFSLDPDLIVGSLLKGI